ncbi:flagellar biosynthetic protein FliR [Thiorhodococcus mannitoliphagus]|uniref:Flagellar biosynthetic protein FliR n=1 Tax=Thiorhodococcus mannitoliphagus TaxID=329406 RepID=A0A6P1DPD0_9GAMM|nr:flagellar biosynthetic protein FliR [Thiorhodococcus mannitoliphagus]NEX20127.1 flagellar biosynthetic protein FliR [Thiorhodococcus mannitoliphagus]
MSFAAEDIFAWVSSFIWPFVRISALLLVAPIFGARNVNVRARLSLGFLLALVVAPQLTETARIDPLSVGGLVVAIHQVIIGIAMGFVMQMVFSALTQAGESIALSMGLGFASTMDPVGGVQVPMVSQYYMILATLLFLALNGHLVLIELLLRSFETLPITPEGLTTENLWAILGFGSTMYAAAVLIALPAIASLLLVNLSMGVITRAAPQLNIFAVGFPLTLLAGFIIVLLTMPSLPARIGELLMSAFSLIQQLTRA